MIDCTTHHTLAILPLTGNPLGADVNPLTSRIYVASMADSDQGGAFAGVSVIDATTHRLCAAVPVGHQVPSASGPVCVKANPRSNRIYVGGNNPTAVAAIDGGCNCVIASLSIEGQILDIGVNPQTNRILVPDYVTGTLAVINGADHSIVATVDGFHNPAGVDVDARADRVYVSHVGMVPILSATTNRTIGLVPLPGKCFIITGGLGGLRVNPFTHRVYLSHQQAGIVFVVEDRPA